LEKIMSKPQIAIIGSGNVGSALRQGVERAGYKVRVTGSDPQEVRSAGVWGDVIILAVPDSARQQVIKNLGDVTGKTIVDPTNLLNTENGSYAGDIKRSGAEEVQQWAKQAHVVKAFNTVFAQNMSTGKVRGEALSLLVAGDDVDAKKRVIDLGNALGFESLDVGPLQNARYLEALGYLNIQLAYGPTQYGADLGFKVVNAPASTMATQERSPSAGPFGAGGGGV
jgi:8-hydroxy-5-deazaflavin:NADPH oxidoreductase